MTDHLPIAKDWSSCMFAAAKAGDTEEVSRIIHHCADNTVITSGIYGAAEGGHYDLMMSFEAPKPSFGLYHAAKGGNMKIIEHFMEFTDYYDEGLRGAAESGNENVVELFVKHCDNFNSAMFGATLFGHTNLVRLFRDLGATNKKRCIELAKQQNYQDIVLLLSSRDCVF